MNTLRTRRATAPAVVLSAALVTALSLAALQACGRAAAPGGCSAADLERNKAVVRIVFDEILSKGRIAENESIYDPEFLNHGPTRDAGRAEDRAASEGWRQAAPDLNVKILRVAAECDLVAVHWEGSGTNTGTGNGLPATGRSIRVWGMTFFRLRDGRIFEEWTQFDQYSMLKQLGLLGK